MEIIYNEYEANQLLKKFEQVKSIEKTVKKIKPIFFTVSIVVIVFFLIFLVWLGAIFYLIGLIILNKFLDRWISLSEKVIDAIKNKRYSVERRKCYKIEVVRVKRRDNDGMLYHFDERYATLEGYDERIKLDDLATNLKEGDNVDIIRIKDEKGDLINPNIDKSKNNFDGIIIKAIIENQEMKQEVDEEESYL